MKNITLLSLVAASLLFVACGEKTKEAATEAKESITEAIKVDSESALESTKKALTEAKAEAQEMADAASDKVAELKETAEKKVTEATEALKETAEEVTAAVTLENVEGKAAYAKCAGCHGANGETKALGKSNPVAGQTAEALAEALHAYKAGTRNVFGMGALMKGQVVSMDDATITAVSEYMAGL